ncbi:hypothetical protein GPJ56_004290 [Histomonas meleagridis]|uniref:uncharacterized protein n=1 Tax=Histomonas meleagridis TaxID=135588 RepID=UPI0035594BF5|nr:hypothetical protein GPJ56_004290 [Histomonas meleagridis]KAH0800495.1 hypothetical protein GO595_006698 [Histomonas meleagridis]
MITVFCLIYFACNVALPTTSAIHGNHDVFLEELFPSLEEEIPFREVPDISEYIESFGEKLDMLANDSFFNLHFINESKPYTLTTLFKNGTLSDITYITEISIDFLHHIQNFEISTEFWIVDEKAPITGCTQWYASVLFETSQSSFCVHFTPTLDHTQCDDDIFLQTNLERNSLSLYHISLKLLTSLTIIVSISAVNAFSDFFSRIKRRNRLTKTVSSFYDLGAFEQFHQVIGFWSPFFLVSYIFSIFCCVFSLVDIHHLTQYPSFGSLCFFGAMFCLMISLTLRWMMPFSQVYRVASIIRLAFGMLLSVSVSLSPFFFALMFVSIFLFGFVCEYSDSFMKLFEAILSLTFGDQLATVYEKYTDRSERYNMFAFLFVTLMVAVGMWLFFTTFTASITYLHRHYMARIVI